MTIRTDNITLRNLVFDLLFRPPRDGREVEFFFTTHMVKLHDPEWVAYAAIHTRHIFRFQHQLTISLPQKIRFIRVTLAAAIVSTASKAVLTVSRKIIKG